MFTIHIKAQRLPYHLGGDVCRMVNGPWPTQILDLGCEELHDNIEACFAMY